MGVVQLRSGAICFLYLFIVVWQAQISGTNGQCGGYFNESGVTITSPNYPAPYPDNTRCEYFIVAPAGYRVKFAFNSEPNSAIPLKIAFGGSTSYQYTLYTILLYHNEDYFNSERNEMYVVFDSDINSSNSSGFSANITFIEECSTQYFSINGSVFSTPNYPDFYYMDMDCEYVVEAPPGMVIRYTFEDFDLADGSCYGDIVLVHDNSNNTDIVFTRICWEGDRRLPEPFITYENYLRLRLISNKFGISRGFMVSVVFEEPRTTYINDGSTMITSDGYPGGSPRSTLHRFIIEAPVGVRMKIAFDMVNLGTSGVTMRCDFILVFESNRLYYVSYAAQSIRCSTDLDGIELQYQVTQGNIALIFYRTYAGAMDGYFVANVTYFTDSDVCHTSPFYSDGSVLTSPFYPEPYPDYTDCSYTIVAPAGFSIKLSFKTFSLQYESSCSYDQFYVYDGLNESGRRLARVCGSTLPNPVFSSGNVMYAKLTSDRATVGDGFYATATFQEIQAYVLVYPAAIYLGKKGDLKMIQNFPPGFGIYFSRASSTGTGVKVPSGTEVETASNSATITIPRDKSKRQVRIGVFNHKMNPPSNYGSFTVATVVHWRGKLSFPEATMTAYRGEDIRLSVEKQNRGVLRWRRNGKVVPKWNGRKSVKIENVQEWQAGVYECYRNKFRRLGQHAIIRVIVQACPRNAWGKPACNMIPAKSCLNGGVRHQEVDTCLCAPGFGGEYCAQMYGPGVYGYNGEYQCPNDDCKGSLICQKDPYGCSCATGYQGPTCNQGCQEGTFGANCEGICHCSEGATCDPLTGICSSGICAMGWNGPNCQVLEMGPL